MSALALAALAAAPAAHADCGSPANAIVAENCKQGTPADVWDVPGAGDDSIRGFATDISVNRGSTVQFKVDTTASSYRIDIYRMGYYGGDGARKIDTVTPADVRNQGGCSTASGGLVDCGNWVVSASWPVPSSAVSGIYFAHLVRTDGTPGESHIFFVVRDDTSHSDIYYQTSDTTWQAYNRYGGASLYTWSGDGAAPLSGGGTPRAAKVSYNRPFTTRGYAPEDWVFNAEYPMVRWLERNGYDVSYETGVDTDRFGSLIRNHRIFMSSGHDEYWSGGQRANVEAARDAGVNLAFFSGNEVFWKTRWESNRRTLVSYKETHEGAKVDPDPAWTGTWMDARAFNPEGAHPQNALSGTLFTVTDGTFAIDVPAEYGRLRFWRGTTVAGLAPGTSATLASGSLGYEWDSDVDNGSRPAGLFDVSSTTVSPSGVLKDFGSTYGPGTATHNMTLYRAPSGALVFGAGTVQWSWGLDGSHDRGGPQPDPRMQQATVNLLADMHAQPATLQAGLTAATASTDTVAPQSSITSPASGATVPAGTPVTVRGMAADAGGGRVAAVEVSVDGGATWYRATGAESWTFDWTPTTTGPLALRSRAVDDSGNLEGRARFDTTPPGVAALSPIDGAVSVDPGTDITATFDEPVDGATVTAGTFGLRDATGAAVTADVSYDPTTHTAILRPRAPLGWSTRYTATLEGGAIADLAGNVLAHDWSWSFTTAAASGAPGPGAASGTAGPGARAAGTASGARVAVSPRTVRASHAGKVKLRIACPRSAGTCRIALRLELRRRVVAGATITVKGGRTRTATLTLSRTARRELLRKRALRVSAVATSTDKAGNRATTRTSTLLLAPRRR